MIKFIKNFSKDEDGAVTVDWVVLTAAVVGLAAVAWTQVKEGTEKVATSIKTELEATGNSLDGPDLGGGSSGGSGGAANE